MTSTNHDLTINNGASSSTADPNTVSSLLSTLCDGKNVTGSTLLDELKKRVDVQGCVSLTQAEMASVLQDYMKKADPKDIDSATPLVSALGLAPDDDFDESDLCSTESLSKEGTPETNWVHIGRFDSFETLEEARKKHGVSRHQTSTYRGLTKMKYRCNQWKRNQCLYKMCCFNTNRHYELYASGEHEHTVSEPRTTRDRRTNDSLNSTPSNQSSVEPDIGGAVLHNALLHAYQNIATNGILPVTSGVSPILALPYSISSIPQPPLPGQMALGPLPSTPFPTSIWSIPTSMPIGFVQPLVSKSESVEPFPPPPTSQKEPFEESEFSNVQIKTEPEDIVEPTPPQSNGFPLHSVKKHPRMDSSSPPSNIATPSTGNGNITSLSLPKNLLNVFEKVTQNDGNDSRTFSLSSGSSISNLLKVATDMQLVFTFDARNGAEFCLHKAGFNVVVIFHDRKKHVDVKTRRDETIISQEVWKKGDFQQFVWAVRGLCAFTFNTTEVDV